MKRTNVEIKARCTKHDMIRDVLRAHRANFKGTDHQIDTYFVVAHGRLKLREGTIENQLIHYQRSNTKGPKQSDITLFPTQPGSAIKDILTKACDVLVVVDKKREIYFIDNVKFHIDTVKDLGTFVEIEAIDDDGSIGTEKLHAQCTRFCELFHIASKDFVSCSYSDLLLQKQKTT